jgi:hypothetical protein
MAKVKDRLWLWGTRVNALQEYGFTESRMTVADGLRYLGLDRATMCGNLPPREEEYLPVGHCRDLVWEMSFDEGFSFDRPLAPIVNLHRNHPNVEGVLLDDFSTTEINRGARPEVLERMRGEMPDSLGLWLVIYSMSLDIPDLDEYLRHADRISFWVWHARELPDLPQAVSRCNRLSGGKPMVLGLYFYDFGENQPMTVKQMEQQVDTGLDLLRSGECEGLCFLSSSVMDVGLETVDWTRRWIQEHGADPI